MMEKKNSCEYFIIDNCICTGLDYSIGIHYLEFYNDSSSGLNVSFESLPDILVESNEVLEFMLSEATINNLNNTNAVTYEPHDKAVVIITDDDGERVKCVLR